MRGRRREKKEGRVQFKEYNHMNGRLHEMLRSLGEEVVSSATIKLDEFQKLRQQFVKRAGELQQSNNLIATESNPVERAKLLFSISDSKMVLEKSIKQMTSIVMKLDQKMKRQVNSAEEEKARVKERAKYYHVETQQQLEKPEKVDPLQKDLQYKMLTLYTLEKNYFRLVKKQSKEVDKTRRDINNKKYASLEEFKVNNPQIDRLLQPEYEQSLQQREVLDALKKIDNLIEQRMDKILEGVKMLNYNAVNISQSLDTVHKKILINLDNVEHNQDKLHQNHKRMQQAAKVVTKPSCICNVIIVVLLGLIGFLVVKLVWLK